MRKRTAQFPLVGGLDQRTAPQLALAPKLTTATNVYRARTAEWAKRNGFHYLPFKYMDRLGNSSNFTMAKVRALGGRGSELVAIDKRRWWSWSPLRQGFHNLSLDAGIVPDIDQRVVTHDLNLSLFRTTEGAESAIAIDSAVGNGYVCTIWQTDQNRVKVLFTEQATGVVVQRTNATSNVGRRPKVVHSENRFCVFNHNQNAGACTLWCDTYDSTGSDGPVFVSSQVVMADLMGTATGECWFDVQVNGANGNVLVAYRSTAPSVKALEWDPTANTVSIAAATVVAGDAGANAIGWVHHDWQATVQPRLATAANSATGVVYRTLSAASLLQTASVTVLASPGDVASITGVRDPATADGVLFWELRNADTTLTSIVEGHSVGPTNRPFMGIGCLASKPFLVDGTDWYIGVTKPWDLQPGYFIVPIRFGAGGNVRVPLGVTARILPGSGMSLPPERNALSHVPGLSTTKFVFPCLRIYDFTIQSGPALILYRQAAYATVDFDGQLPRPISYSRTMMAPGSVCKTYAGESVSDGGFMVAPEAPTLASGGAGALIGSHQYKVVWAITDGEGRTWRSAASPPTTFVAASNLIAVTFKHPFLSSSWISISYGSTCAVAEVYRTKAGGTTFFRLPSAFGGNPFPLLGTAQTQTFNDNTSDALLEQQLPLYTDGGELFNEPAPPMISAAVVGDRVVGIPAERRTSVVASKAMVPGQGLGFHPDLDVPITADGENYAVAAMEGRTIVFKRQAIYMLTGDWPTNLGTGSLPIAQRIAVNFGTISATSVRESDQGIWFKDPAKGMCLLTRGLEVVQLGKPVQAFDSSTIVGVEASEDDEHVRLHTTGGSVLVYDYLEKQWSTWAMGGGVPSCAAVVGGVYYYGTADGRVGFYNLASFQDDLGGLGDYEAALELRFDLAGKEGVQRLYRLHLVGSAFAAVTLLGRFSNDYVTGAEKAGLLTAATGTNVSEFRPEVGRSTTFTFRARFTSSDQGVRFAAIAIEFGVRDQPGLRRLPSGSIQ